MNSAKNANDDDIYWQWRLYIVADDNGASVTNDVFDGDKHADEVILIHFWKPKW